MKIQEQIQDILLSALKPEHIRIVNESSKHNVPKNSETHFHITLVSQEFEGVSTVDQHRMIYKLLSEQMQQGVHALSLHTYTPTQWLNESNPSTQSPQCVSKK